MKKTISVLIIFTNILLLAGCTPKMNKYEKSYMDVFDTLTQIVGYYNSQDEFNEASTFIHDELLNCHRLFDIYNNYEGINNIKTINDNAGIAPVKVDKKIIDLIIFSMSMYEKTNGKTDIAIGSVLKIWNEYRQNGINNPDKATLPPISELKAAFKHSDFENIIIDKNNSTVFIKDPLMNIDVGAVAKGFAVGLVCDEAKAKGFDHLLVTAGGNIVTIGDKDTNGSKWKLGIRNPFDDSNNYIKVMELSNTSLVTSGDYERFYEVDGKRYHHIIDTDTLMPANYFSSVSIIAKDSGIADALSTALFSMSYEDGQKLLEQFDNVKAVWVKKDGTVLSSDGI